MSERFLNRDGSGASPAYGASAATVADDPSDDLGVAGRAAVLNNRTRWHRQASRTTITGVVARVFAIAVRFVTIPLALHLLGPERYGLWLSIGSLLAWIGFVGPGLGYGLVNALSEAAGRDDWLTMRRHVSTAVFTILFIGMLLLTASPALASWSDLTRLLGVADRPDLARETLALAGVAAGLFALSFSLEFIGPLCSGLQEGYLPAVASMAASVALFTGIALMAWKGGTLVGFALVVGIPPLVANLILAAYVLFWRFPQLRPSWRLWNRDSFRTLMGFGGWMFLVQIGDLAIFQSANIMIANRFGPGEVTRYAVPTALFLNVSNLCYLIVQPYWPAMKEASVRQDWDWIRSTMFRTLGIRVGLMVAAAIAIVIGGPWFIRLWAGEQEIPTRTLLLAMSLYYVLVTISGNYVVLLLGLGLVRTKALLTMVVGVSHMAGFLLLSPYLGLSALPVGGAIGVFLDCLFASRAASRYIRDKRTASFLETTNRGFLEGAGAAN